MELQKLLDKITEGYRDIQKDNLAGIYVHGSVAFGCFNPKKSDIDYIAVVYDALSREKKRELMDFTVGLNKQAPPKGLEMSVVLKKHCREFCYPTRFELHFSPAHENWYAADPEDYCERMNGEDKDLAAHFMVIKHTGITLFGEPVSEVFGDVPARCYLESISDDIKNAKADIKQNPVYIILNLCRVAAYKRDGLILSKKQGAQWAKEHLPLSKELKIIITRALRCYQTDETMKIEDKEADDFCECFVWG